MPARGNAAFALAVGSYCLVSTLRCGGQLPDENPDGTTSEIIGFDGGRFDGGRFDGGRLDGGRFDGGIGSGDGGGESVAIVASCAIPLLIPDGGYTLRTGIPYNSIAGPLNTLEVAFPPPDGGLHPMVVLIHGGGFRFGGSSAHRTNIEFLATQGYTAASISYRLDSPTVAGFPMEVQDVRCAVRYLRANAALYDGDPTRFAAMGDSAGGYFADMLGVGGDIPADAGLDGPCPWSSTPVGVTATVAYYGPADLRDLNLFGSTMPGTIDGGSQALISQFLGGTPTQLPVEAALASPVVHADSQSAPSLLVHGTADPGVLIQNSERMWQALRDNGVPATLIELKGASHGFPIFNPGLPVSTCTTLAFLKSWLNP